MYSKSKNMKRFKCGKTSSSLSSLDNKKSYCKTKPKKMVQQEKKITYTGYW